MTGIFESPVNTKTVKQQVKAYEDMSNYQVSEIGRSTLAKLNYAVFEQLGVASSWPKVEKDLLLYGSSAFTSDGVVE